MSDRKLIWWGVAAFIVGMVLGAFQNFIVGTIGKMLMLLAAYLLGRYDERQEAKPNGAV